MTRPCFPSDHVVEALRDFPIPTWMRMKRALAQRCAWLDARIGQRVALGLPVRRELEELAAIVALVELAERMGAGSEKISDLVVNGSEIPNSRTEDGEPVAGGAP